MKAFRLALLALAIMPGASAPALATPQALSAAEQNAISAAVSKELVAFGGKKPVPGAIVGVWKEGYAGYVTLTGYGNLAHLTPMALGDHVRIGSNTKTFVTTVLLQLADEGKLHLDDTLASFHLGLSVPNEDRITLRQLAEMRSGIIDVYSIPSVQKQNDAWWARQTPRSWVATAAKQPPLFSPGAKYNYSNTNWFLLGLIIEKVSGDTLESEIKSRILNPLRLTQTSFPTRPALPEPYAHGYTLTGNAWIDESNAIPPSATWAAGAMISTSGDLKTWVKAYVKGTTNSAASQRARLTCLPTGTGNLAFGLGVGCSAGWYGYTGGITGYNTGAYYLPAKDSTIVVLVNSQREQPFPGVANAIVRDIARIVSPDNVPFVK
jgi:D-alanyl-D-alanine carboxypeptidase